MSFGVTQLECAEHASVLSESQVFVDSFAVAEDASFNPVFRRFLTHIDVVVRSSLRPVSLRLAVMCPDVFRHIRDKFEIFDTLELTVLHL